MLVLLYAPTAILQRETKTRYCGSSNSLRIRSMEEASNARIASVRKIARRLLTDVGVTKPPIMIRDIVNHLKKAADLSVYPWAFGDNIDGIQTTQGESSAIGYNQNQHRHRQRFTVAHEIGHFIMGHVNESSHFDLNSKKPEEIEANQFAAELLMPLHMLKGEIARGNKNAKDIAKVFDVSEEAVWWRIKECNLIGKL